MIRSTTRNNGEFLTFVEFRPVSAAGCGLVAISAMCASCLVFAIHGPMGRAYCTCFAAMVGILPLFYLSRRADRGMGSSDDSQEAWGGRLGP